MGVVVEVLQKSENGWWLIRYKSNFLKPCNLQLMNVWSFERSKLKSLLFWQTQWENRLHPNSTPEALQLPSCPNGSWDSRSEQLILPPRPLPQLASQPFPWKPAPAVTRHVLVTWFNPRWEHPEVQVPEHAAWAASPTAWRSQEETTHQTGESTSSPSHHHGAG